MLYKDQYEGTGWKYYLTVLEFPRTKNDFNRDRQIKLVFAISLASLDASHER
jgi:hypothetical protein